MQIIKPHVVSVNLPNPQELYWVIEQAGRICYQSEPKDSVSPDDFIKRLIARGHESVLEHGNISLQFVCDRGVTHEQVRHRIASYSQESTRYCNYSQDKFGNSISFIDLWGGIQQEGLLTPGQANLVLEEWVDACQYAEKKYLRMLELGASPQIARSVLPQSVKTSIVVTMNIREWRHFFRLRYFGTTGKPHPQMVELSRLAWEMLSERYPALFMDLQESKS